jgi:Rad3-related DNA helicase
MTILFHLLRLTGIAALACFLFVSAAGAQAISKETLDRLANEIKQLQDQVNAANALVDQKAAELAQQEKVIERAPEDTDKMINDLENLINKFKAGSPLANSAQKAIEEIKVLIDKFREGSDNEKLAAASLRETLQRFQNDDANRDDIVGRGMAAVRNLRSRKDDLTALRIAGAYRRMQEVYGEMISTARTTVDQADRVVKSFGLTANVPSQ